MEQRSQEHTGVDAPCSSSHAAHAKDPGTARSRDASNAAAHGAQPAGRAKGKSLQDAINTEVLMNIKEAFDKADHDGSGELNIDEFVEAFSGS